MALKEKIVERNLNAENVLIASFMAGLNEFQILNQGLVNKVCSLSGKFLSQFALETTPFEIDPNLNSYDQSEKIIHYCNEILHISSQVKTQQEDQVIVVRIETQKCRFCPVGIGEAVLTGTLCPFPSLIEAFVNEVGTHKIKLIKERNNPVLEKCNDWCVIRYELRNENE